VRFVLDGESFDIDAETVRRRLHGHVPEEVRAYWVEIDGHRWPVKQALHLATGASRTRFQSETARRVLSNLGFTIAGAGDARSRTSEGRLAFDPGVLRQVEAVDVTIKFSWLHVGTVVLDGEGFPLFPPLPAQPGLYRFGFGPNASGTRTFYIGESTNLRRRASNYRNAKTDRSRQRTSRRIHKEIVSHLLDGGSIEFAIAVEVESSGEGPPDLRLKSLRRLAENAAVVVAQQRPSTRVLNIDAELDAADA
jgi:hypothetical protein